MEQNVNKYYWNLSCGGKNHTLENLPLLEYILKSKIESFYDINTNLGPPNPYVD